ncbi:MAG: beta-class carbonic anhydrase [Candidatus Dormibacteraceae bacterium]
MNSRLHHLGSAARIAEPAQRLAILTCMDARIDINAVLGLRPGDAHIVRNAGGRASAEALRALAISQGVMRTREVMVIHHTECALGRFNQAQLEEMISVANGRRFTDDLDCFGDPTAAVAEDLGRLRAYPYLPFRDKIRGFIYDLASNAVTEVLSDDGAPL